MDWNDLRFFLAVARSGSLTRTSADLRVSQSTVSRRISEFERSLGMKLFARHQTGYFLTDAGREVLRDAETVEESILSLERGATGLDKAPAGAVRLATSDSLATDLIIPAMPAFRERYPRIRLEIVTSTVAAELGRHEADIALRVVRPTRGNLKVRRVGHMTYSVYGSRAYVEQFPFIEGEPLGGRHFITWDESHAHLPAAVWLAREHPDCQIALTTTSLPTQIAAVRAGLGLAVVPDFLAVGEDFIRVIPADQMFSNDVWLVTHADLVASARIRAVSDFLADQVNANPDLTR
ncbi:MULTISPECIES: LysR family transcriptional regulator [Rhodopseudomonas]|uniref:LysR family transcriptional regulator n=1 Tax=Rhodopseudomonas palustris TaxID=1076 RepID=A0A0D7DZN6_RHOPL|nr:MULTISPECIES: LysR family transcriptional regulator [Rhodopseudomonas]KIZ34048.1 LysR family transcriptional regulator [Rhodopseudomonas palustris]MDF3808678.1 LysR family transcriptional regulator [Rhodopseudomonas sp. BAL398]WOK19561.1 LysR family transcriptional regulator [Rhodopseudomonas sp. BAL398]